jgi:predicted permease
VTLDGRSYQIAGVAARLFGGVQPGCRTDVWVPLSLAADARVLTNPDGGNFRVWGRVRDEAGQSALRERLQASLTNFIRDRVRINPPRNLQGAQLQQFIEAPLRVRDASSGADSLFRLQFRQPLWILALISALLLLIACTNVANLMLARASARAHEMALRVSLGAARSRLMQQMVMESGQIAAAACVFGVLFAAVVAPAVVVRLGPTEFPAWLEVTPDFRMLSFAAAVSVVTALLFGVAPALRASSTSPDTALKAGATRHSGRMGPLRWILTAEIGFSVAVLFLAGLLLLSFRKLIAVDLGFAPDGVALFDLAPRQRGDSERQSGAELLAHLRRMPGVEAASISQQRPMGGDRALIMMPFVRLRGRPVEAVRPVEVPVSAGFFGAMRIRWIAGRDFLPEEVAANSEAVIVNQAFVDKFFRGQNPIGQRFEKLTDDPDPVRQQIVGVVGNARYNNLREPERPSLYTPLRDAAGATLNIRMMAGEASMIPSLRKEIEAAAPRLMVRGSILLQTQIDDSMIRERLLALLAGFFSAIAMLLTGVGLYGVINYSAVRRTREIGIRLALGARRGTVVGLMISDTLLIVMVGLGVGIGGGMGLGRYLASQLFGVKATDFWSLTAPMVCLLLVAAGAVLPPALRAAKADPLAALRHE